MHPVDVHVGLAHLYQRGRAAWPGLAVDERAFLAHVASLVAEGDTSESIAKLHAEDLYLAHACGAGDGRAIAEIEKQLVGQVPAYIARTTTSADAVQEVLQRLRERLLVRRGDEPPRIMTYTGRGPLGAFLRVVAVRIAHDVVPQKQQPVAAEVAIALDPELDYIKAAYRVPFMRAIERALSALPPRDRNALALSAVDGLSTDAIGKIYGKDGATIRRWLAKARQQVLDGTMALLREELGANPDELESLLGILGSRLDVSIVRILAENRDEGAG